MATIFGYEKIAPLYKNILKKDTERIKRYVMPYKTTRAHTFEWRPHGVLLVVSVGNSLEASLCLDL